MSPEEQQFHYDRLSRETEKLIHLRETQKIERENNKKVQDIEKKKGEKEKKKKEEDAHERDQIAAEMEVTKDTEKRKHLLQAVISDSVASGFPIPRSLMELLQSMNGISLFKKDISITKINIFFMKQVPLQFFELV